MILSQSLLSAFGSPDPAQVLRAAIEKMFLEGHTKEEIYDSLERLLLLLREHGARGSDFEDLVLDTMDALTAWCHPSAQLLPHSDTPSPTSRDQ